MICMSKLGKNQSTDSTQTFLLKEKSYCDLENLKMESMTLKMESISLHPFQFFALISDIPLQVWKKKTSTASKDTFNLRLET